MLTIIAIRYIYKYMLQIQIIQIIRFGNFAATHYFCEKLEKQQEATTILTIIPKCFSYIYRYMLQIQILQIIRIH